MADAAATFRDLMARNRAGQAVGVASVCTAHPLAIRAALDLAAERGQLAVIEATCNQVNQEGGYAGLRPQGFADLVAKLAAEAGLGPDGVLLGGDHLGPQPWRALGADAAMARAEAMVAGYAGAGFRKLHLDCSMPCAGDPDPLPEPEVAARAARLSAAAEATGARPLYVVGTEVPAPGGMGAGHGIVPTAPEAVRATWAAHRAAFRAAGLGDAFGRVAALVVQPGLDFGNDRVHAYDPSGSRALSAALLDLPGAVFEAHSTDFQAPAAYRALVAGHFAVLKVGPAATFALREALFALEAIEAELVPAPDRSGLRAALDRAMLADPRHWRGHYPEGDALLRAFSYSDRLRYYWAEPGVEAAVGRLRRALSSRGVPPLLVSQHLPHLAGAVRDGSVAPEPDALARAAVRAALAPYADACGDHAPAPAARPKEAAWPR